MDQGAYNFRDIEKKWREYWVSERTFRAHGPGDEGFDPGRPKFYMLDMFPYTSGDGLHIGHAKSICLSFGIAEKFNGSCNLRFDDTNPTKEEVEFVESIKDDIRWLGFDWQDREYFASDYFEQLYQWACQLIGEGLAFVCIVER